MKESKIKVVHFFGKMDMGGAETFIMNVYRKINKEVEFHFIVTDFGQGKYDNEIISLGGKIHKVNLSKNLINYYNQIKYIVNKENISIAHTHVHYFSGINSMFLKKIGVKNIISHSHNIQDGQSENPYRKIYRKIMQKLILKNSNYLLACTDEAGRALFGETKEFQVINNGIDLDLFSKKIDIIKKKNELNLEKNKFVIGHVGRFEEQKNHEFLIKVFKYITEINEEVVLVSIGEGKNKKAIEQKCEEYGISSKVKFLGNRSDVNEIMQIFDVFLFPSLYEGLGIVLVEAQAAGIRCVTSDTVPREVDLTGNIKFLNLQEDISLWGKETLEGQISNKKNHLKEYDINKISTEMYDIYNMGEI